MKLLENRGQANFTALVLAMSGAFGVLIYFYAWLLMWDPITQDLVFPTLDNIAHGSTIQTFILLVPLIIGILIIVTVIKVGLGSGGQQTGYYFPPSP